MTGGPLADRAWQLLSDGLTPQQIIAKLIPTTKPEALDMARRLPLLSDRPDADRGAAIARIVTRIGMKRYGLAFTPDGRLGDDLTYTRHTTPPTTRTLPGDGCTVEYTVGYFRDRDHFQFTGHGTPPQPHPLSPGGHWSHFADPDAVIALGGPEAYIAAMTAAGRDGQQEFERGFTGREPEPARKPRKPVVGEHTAKVVPPVRAESPQRTHEPPRDEQAAGTQPPLGNEPRRGQPDLFTQAEGPSRDR